jgi:hypothetical protein
LIRTSSDLPTGAVVSLLDYFTRPRANNQPLAQYLMNELARQKKSETPEVSPPTITEQEAVDVMSKRFLYVLRASSSSSSSLRGCGADHLVRLRRNVLVARRENFAFLLQYMKSFPLEQITVQSSPPPKPPQGAARDCFVRSFGLTTRVCCVCVRPRCCSISSTT